MTMTSASGADRLPLPAYGAIVGEVPSPFAVSCGLFHTTSEAVGEIRLDLQLLVEVGLTSDQLARAERIHFAAVALRQQVKDLIASIALTS